MKSDRKLIKIVALAAVLLTCSALLIGLILTLLRTDPDSASKGIQSEASVPRNASLEELTQISRFRTAYIEANGGLQGIDNLNSLRVSGTFESNGQTVPFRSLKKRPDQGITTLQMPDYTLSFVVNGAEVWQRVEQPGQAPVDTLMKGQEAAALVDLGYFFDPIMHVILSESSSIQGITVDEWESQPTLRMQFASTSRKVNATVHFDPATLTPLVRIEQFSDGSERKVLYNDYRSINGSIKQPYLIETFLKGDLLNRVAIERIQVNPGIGSFIFEYTGDPTSTNAEAN